MALIRYQSSDDPGFVVFDQTRFRVDHGMFTLHSLAVEERVRALVAERAAWNVQALGLSRESRTLVACLELLENLREHSAPDAIVLPDFYLEPALHMVAGPLITAGEYDRVECPHCRVSYPRDQVVLEPWAFEQDGVTARGHRSLCPAGHTLHAAVDVLESPGIEVED
jgi:hypothetical protein